MIYPPQLSAAVPTPTWMIRRSTAPFRLKTCTLSCLVTMTEDLRLIAGWCCSHQLLINPSKTKLIFFGTRQLLSKVSDIRVPFLDQELTPVSSVKDLSTTLDSYLMISHVNTLTSSLPSMSCQISGVRHLFTKPVLSTILNSLIFS